VDTLELLGQEVLWTLPVLAVTVLINFIVMRVFFGLSPIEVLHEVEEDQNTAVGALFFGTALLMSNMVGKAIADPPEETRLGIALAWLALALAFALLYLIVTVFIIFTLLGRRKGERFRVYLTREIIAENNAALIFFILGIAAVPFTVATHIIV
jgi:hypothetical protein